MSLGNFTPAHPQMALKISWKPVEKDGIFHQFPTKLVLPRDICAAPAAPSHLLEGSVVILLSNDRHDAALHRMHLGDGIPCGSPPLRGNPFFKRCLLVCWCLLYQWRQTKGKSPWFFGMFLKYWKVSGPRRTNLDLAPSASWWGEWAARSLEGLQDFVHKLTQRVLYGSIVILILHGFRNLRELKARGVDFPKAAGWSQFVHDPH